MGSETGGSELAPARWFTPDDPPTEPGLYYWEHCDSAGRPHCGMWLWEPGKPIEMPKLCPPSVCGNKFFGPIRGAMQPWEKLDV
jgi:hypothetical protein